LFAEGDLYAFWVEISSWSWCGIPDAYERLEKEVKCRGIKAYCCNECSIISASIHELSGTSHARVEDKIRSGEIEAEGSATLYILLGINKVEDCKREPPLLSAEVRMHTAKIKTAGRENPWVRQGVRR
jgi:hypothetical protein